jgi:hypothetical protein
MTRAVRSLARGLALGLTLALVGCQGLLDADNPNSVPDDEIRNPRTAPALLSGVHASLARAVNNVTLAEATASDELDWVGSRDAWRQLDNGDLSDPFNEFTDAAFPFLGQTRWFADEAVEVMNEHRAAGRLLPTNVDPVLYVRAYLYSAIAYVTIGDLFDRWAFSDMRTPGPPIAPADMRQVYDTAIAYLDRGIQYADSLNANLASVRIWRLTAYAMRARAKHARAVWNMIGPVPAAPAAITNGGLVNDAGAVADAQAAISQALAVSGAGADWKFQFTYSPTTVTGDFGPWINDRTEMRLGDAYVFASANNKTWDSTRIMDPFAKDTVITIVDSVTRDTVIRPKRDPVLDATARVFKAGAAYPSFTAVSVREMRLILAEGRLAVGDTAGFATEVNALRSLNGLAAWNPAAPQIRADSLLWYERQVNLFLQGRRLADMYRFGIRAAKWQPTSEAVTQPGRFLPITARECLSNPLIGPSQCRI